jgi:hypothetical protein
MRETHLLMRIDSFRDLRRRGIVASAVASRPPGRIEPRPRRTPTMSTTCTIGRAYPIPSTRLAASRLLALTAAAWLQPSTIPHGLASPVASRRREPCARPGRPEPWSMPDNGMAIDLMRYGL